MNPSQLFLTLVLIGGCSKKPSADVQPLLDSVRVDARAVADAAAKTCGAQFASGQFYANPTSCGAKLLPGQSIVPSIESPAKGTPLDANASVTEVQTQCWAPTGAPGKMQETCGSSLSSLRNAFGMQDFQSGNWNTTEDNCKASPTSCEKVESPSRYSKNTSSVDLTVIRPMVGGPAGGTVSVTITVEKH